MPEQRGGGGCPVPCPPLDGALVLLPKALPGSPAPRQGASFPTWIAAGGRCEK